MPRGDGTAAFLSTIATELLAERDETRTVEAIVTRAVETVDGADQATLTVRTAGRRRALHETIGSTDPRVAELDGLQDDLGEGPVLDTLGGAEWVRSGDLGADTRWPDWGSRAIEQGYRSLLSVRLEWAWEPLGTLTFYSADSGRFVEPDIVDLAVLYSVHAANALGSARQLAGLETAMSSRHVIGMAQGILMERYRLDPEQAFAFLTRRSSQENRKLRDLALDLVSHREDHRTDGVELDDLLD